jgi:hypothetical protein
VGREIKRVALGFDHPVGELWSGYVMSDDLYGPMCVACDGTGESPAWKWVLHFAYGMVAVTKDVLVQEQGGQIPWRLQNEADPPTRFRVAKTLARGAGQVDLDVVFGPRRVAPWDRLPFGAQISNAIERAWSLTQGDADAIAESPTLAMLTGLRFAHVQASAVAILVRDEPTRYAWAKANNELGVPPNNVSDVVFRGAVLGFAVLPYPDGLQYATELLTPYMAHIHRTTNPVEVKA